MPFTRCNRPMTALPHNDSARPGIRLMAPEVCASRSNVCQARLECDGSRSQDGETSLPCDNQVSEEQGREEILANRRARKKKMRLDKTRVPCPFDPSHDCYASDLHHHLNRCPSRKHHMKLDSKPFTEKNVNAGCNHSATRALQHMQEAEPLDGTEPRVAHSFKLGLSGMHSLIAKIKKIAAQVDLAEEPPLQQLCPDSCSKLLCEVSEREMVVPLNKKHATQFASIVGHLERAGLLDDAANTTFADLGAGKAYLTLMIARATEACNFIINDNQTFKNKADRILRRFVRDDVKHTAFVRCQADLKDFVVSGALEELQATAKSASAAPHLQKTPSKVVGVGKHLCGGATDLALRSLISYNNAVEEGTSGDPPVASGAGSRRLAGLCIAPCCHHRCTWEAYVGKDELMALGLSQREIELAFWMAGWALCGHDPQELPRLVEEEAKAKETDSEPGSAGPNPGAAAEGISLRDRVIVGTQCKRLIEYGRLKWIERQGECDVSEVVAYVDPSFSGENRLIVVRFK